MRRSTCLRAVIAAGLLAMAFGGRASADPAVRGPVRLDLSRLASPYDEGQASKAAGVAHTSLDRSLGRSAAASASVGFLCGLQPSNVTSGMAAARGVDHDGRFLGAQLRLGFR